MKYLLACSVILILMMVPSFAQQDSARFDVDLSVRYRFEAWDGMNARNYGDNSTAAIGDLNDNILYQRIIAGFTYRPTGRITIAAHLQDSRAFGWSLRNSRYPELFRVRAPGTEKPFYTMNPNESFFELFDAYIAYQVAFQRLDITFGRQKINYGDNRIFGPGDWGNTGRWTWDALKLSFRHGDHFVDVFGGGTKIHDPQEMSIPFSNTEYWGGGLYAHVHLPELVHVEPFYAYKSQGSAGYISTRSINRHWAGLRFYNNHLHSFTVDLTLAKQEGSEDGKSIDAYGIVGKLGYRFKSIWSQPVISIRETYASGGRKNETKIRTFEPAFGANDSYYGRMNIISWSNIDNRELLIEATPITGMHVELSYNRYFVPEPESATYAGTLRLEAGESHLGDELNIFVRYRVHANWQAVSAFGYFIPGRVEQINNRPAKPSTWFALQVLYEL